MISPRLVSDQRVKFRDAFYLLSIFFVSGRPTNKIISYTEFLPAFIIPNEALITIFS
jgi:hypothetical protein